MRILILETKEVINIDYTFANRLVKSGKAEWVKGTAKKAVPEPETKPEIAEQKEIIEEVKPDVEKPEIIAYKGKKYTLEQINSMDKRTGLYKELIALSKK